jgi:putative membrane protein
MEFMPMLHHGGIESSAIWLTLSLALTALVYLRGWLHLYSTFANVVAVWRAISFLLGLLLIWAAVASPIAALDHELLTVHMLQHLLLMTIAPPLLWLGAPVMILMPGLPRQFVHTVIHPLLQSALVQTAGRALTNPALCWLAATAALVGWHIPALFTLGLQSEGWHLAEHASFLAAGLLFWWPVVRPWPSVSRWPELSMILYLFFATLPCDILSGFLVFCDRVVYAVYFTAPRAFGISALEDQQCAGALMWTLVTVVYLVAGAVLTTRLLSRRSWSEDEVAKLEMPGRPVAQKVLNILGAL